MGCHVGKDCQICRNRLKNSRLHTRAQVAPFQDDTAAAAPDPMWHGI
jgi:hypothetical protein